VLGTEFAPWPSYTEEEAEAVTKVLLSNKVNYWTGNECRLFEEEFSSYVGAKYSIAVANGTVALDLALRSLQLEQGDEVIVTSRTFIASVSSIVNAGGTPVFADICKESQNITIENIEDVFSPRTRGIICVHLAGWPCDMDPITQFARENGLFVIEDCAQAHGAIYKGRSVGTMGDIGCWSFCQDKIITTGGEGGMITTNDELLWNKMWSLKDHGKSFEAVYRKEHAAGFRWLHESFGDNARMTEMQGALGRIQLRRLSSWNRDRNRNQSSIWDKAKYIKGLRVPSFDYSAFRDSSPNESFVHGAYKCYLFLDPEACGAGWDRDKVIEEVVSRGVPCGPGSCSEVYLEKAFNDRVFKPSSRLPVARLLGETALMFLIHPTLRVREIKKTCDVLEEVMTMAAS
jgi:dTDP-4-amino-4,6-dideoxygalactose transaminase